MKPRSASLLFASGIALTQIAAGSDRVSDFVIGQKMMMIPESETGNVTALVISVPEEMILRRL